MMINDKYFFLGVLWSVCFSSVCRILCTFSMTVQIDQEEEMAGMEVGV